MKYTMVPSSSGGSAAKAWLFKIDYCKNTNSIYVASTFDILPVDILSQKVNKCFAIEVFRIDVSEIIINEKVNKNVKSN